MLAPARKCDGSITYSTRAETTVTFPGDDAQTHAEYSILSLFSPAQNCSQAPMEGVGQAFGLKVKNKTVSWADHYGVFCPVGIERKTFQIGGDTMINEQDRIIVSEERRNTESAPSNNLLHSPTGVKPSPEVLCKPDTGIDRPLEKRCYTVEDLQTILSCGRETVYALLATNEFRWFRLGGQRGSYRISRKSFDEWLDHYM